MRLIYLVLISTILHTSSFAGLGYSKSYSEAPSASVICPVDLDGEGIHHLYVSFVFNTASLDEKLQVSDCADLVRNIKIQIFSKTMEILTNKTKISLADLKNIRSEINETSSKIIENDIGKSKFKNRVSISFALDAFYLKPILKEKKSL